MFVCHGLGHTGVTAAEISTRPQLRSSYSFEDKLRGAYNIYIHTFNSFCGLMRLYSFMCMFYSVYSWQCYLCLGMEMNNLETRLMLDNLKSEMNNFKMEVRLEYCKWLKE